MVAVPVALQGRLPTSWVPSLFGSQRPLEGNRHYAHALRAFNMAVEPISLNMSDLLIVDSLCARNRLSLNCCELAI